tara:strand:+ start:614 stop:793 length:180 start_codon:yes stop_codon:yes gene_type:complete
MYVMGVPLWLSYVYVSKEGYVYYDDEGEPLPYPDDPDPDGDFERRAVSRERWSADPDGL